jgi:hypothetical protein
MTRNQYFAGLDLFEPLGLHTHFAELREVLSH